MKTQTEYQRGASHAVIVGLFAVGMGLMFGEVLEFLIKHLDFSRWYNVIVLLGGTGFLVYYIVWLLNFLHRKLYQATYKEEGLK